MTFDDATRIRVIRAMLGIDSKSFAAKVGVRPETMSGWEHGHYTPQPSKREELAKLCSEHGIGFTPSGFPFPIAECMMFRSQEGRSAGNSD